MPIPVLLPNPKRHLVIVESKTKTKTLEKIMRSSEKFGKDSWTVMASSGHVEDLPKKELGINEQDDFRPRYVLLPDKKKTIDFLKKKAREVDCVWMATDKDYEGERIAQSLVNRLNLSHFYRVYFTEITPSAITHAFSIPHSQLHPLYLECQETRRVTDRLIGYKLSPVLWRHFPGHYKISIGRVQSALLRICWEKEEKINHSEQNLSWRLAGDFSPLEKECSFQHEFSSSQQVESYLESLSGDFNVTTKEPRSFCTNPPPPFITSSLQVSAYQDLGMSLQETVLSCQQLYEKGKITYPRTDSHYLSQDFQKNAQAFLAQKYGQEHISQEMNESVKNRSNAQEAHEAIRPTHSELMDLSESYTPAQKKMYRMIWKRTMASLLRPSQWEEMVVEIRSSSPVPKNYYFKGSLKKCIYPGYRILDGLTPDHEMEWEIMKQEIHEKLFCQKITATESWSDAPIRYDEAGLVKKMESLGIGRPATYQCSVEKIIQKGYVERFSSEGKNQVIHLYLWKSPGEPIQKSTKNIMMGREKNRLRLTNLGHLIFCFLQKYFNELTTISFTADLESKMDGILAETHQRSHLLKEFSEKLQTLLKQPMEKMIPTTSSTSSANPQQHKAKSEPLKRIKIGRKIYDVMNGKFGPFLKFNFDKKVVNISLKAYLQYTKCSVEELQERDVKLLTSFPFTTQSGQKIGYGRYGFYDMNCKIPLTREIMESIFREIMGND